MSRLINKIAILQCIADIDFSFDVPDSEKDIANDALIRFEAVVKKIRDINDHLDIIYEPFQRNKKVPTKSLVAKRGLLNRYKQKVKRNFNELKAIAILAIQKLNNFINGDIVIDDILTSFIGAVEDVEKQAENFLDIMGDYEDIEFRGNVLSAVDGINKQMKELETMVKDSIIDHIDKNILARTWMNDTKNQLQLEDEDAEPLVSLLFKQREEAANGKFPSSEIQPQSLNTSDAPRMLYPGDPQAIKHMGE